MPTNDNRFERISDVAAGVIVRQKEAVSKAFQLEGRGYRQVALKREEVGPYFASLSPEEQTKKWDALSDTQKAQVNQHMGR